MSLDHLLEPLSTGGEPCGEDMIFSHEFDAIREARRSEDPSLAQGDWVAPIKEADWPEVIAICDDILRTKAKDLRVAGWLAEASGKTRGLAGLADGFDLLAGLCQRYWNDIHPRIEDGDQEQRAGALEWLINQSVTIIRETPLTESVKGHFSLLHRSSALNQAYSGERGIDTTDSPASGGVTLDMFEAAIRDTPRHRLAATGAEAARLVAAMRSLQDFLAPRLEDLSPSFAPAYDILDDVTRLIGRHNAEPEPAASASMAAGNDLSAATVQLIRPPGDQKASFSIAQPASREEAIRQLQEIAAFFRATEPHSPVAYLADKAARWGRMPLHAWLQSVLKDEATLARVEELLGIDTSPANAGEG